MINSKSYDANEITGAQIRAARALVNWSAKELAKTAGIGVATVSRAEVEDGTTSLTAANVRAIRQALEAAGVEFVSKNGGGVGVRFRT
ncbi:helix-turn-helix transcriptional regulator [Aminobacter anthyllidis]|uniref:Helix-turn-helix transcriptional regulator n=1 Tax=Aminobacter anthyllidis TaxID=1035067 RepID=A0A9X1AAF4_9HYPH|nr:helix-turn-helix transcriptional regulator [Aminobacter anthyllidis]MBT1155887.1 helix-turn-helix transcriptional regulator [Aminobacter anthyllidis]